MWPTYHYHIDFVEYICIIEQVIHFKYLGNDIGYDKNCDTDDNLSKFQTICETINGIFRNKICQEKQLKLYKFTAVPVRSSSSSSS